MRERFFGWLQLLRLVQYGTSILLFDPAGQVLLVKHRLRGGWEWPAGGGKLGELPEEAVARETLEEVGILVTNPRLVAVYARRRPGLATRFNFTFAAAVSREAAAGGKLDRLELTDMRWVEPQEALELLTPRLRQRFEKALAAWQENHFAYLAGSE